MKFIIATVVLLFSLDIVQTTIQFHGFHDLNSPSCNEWDKMLSESDIKDIIQVHNNFRNQIALKTHIRKDSCKFPKASNMLQMYWSVNIAAKAQQWANKCSGEYSYKDFRKQINFSTGENIHEEECTGKFCIMNWTKVIADWFNQIQNFGSKIGSFSIGTDKGDRGKVSEFTQVIWARSYLVGCGYARFRRGGKYIGFYVCHYGPEGNVEEEPVYHKNGDECGDCPSGTQCTNPKYTGLCCLLSQCYEIKHKGEFIDMGDKS